MSISNKCTVTIDGNSFDAINASVEFSSEKDLNGAPKMGSLDSSIRVWADFYDVQNLPYGTLSSVFGLANLPDTSKIKAMKVVFWKDATKQVALVSYSFNGWISRFETTNPIDLSTTDPDLVAFQGGMPGVNHLMVLDLTPAMDAKNFPSITASN